MGPLGRLFGHALLLLRLLRLRWLVWTGGVEAGGAEGLCGEGRSPRGGNGGLPFSTPVIAKA